MGRPRIYANDAARQRAFRARRRLKQCERQVLPAISSGPGFISTIIGQARTEGAEAAIREILEKYPPVRRLEDVMGPEPTPDEADEVDAFLQARDHWRQPYLIPAEETL